MDLSHKLYLKFGTFVPRVLIKLGITANAITIFNLFLTLGLGCYFFSQGRWYMALGVMAVNVILDYADGDVAKTTGTMSQVGVWLDNYGDVIVQNAIMGAIGLGCYKLGLPVVAIVLFFIANATLNMVSYKYNDTFGFTSYKGSELFRQYMDKKKSLVNRAFKNLIDPTASFVGLFFYTVRYWIILGILTGRMPEAFICITVLALFRGVFMYIVYALHLAEYRKVWLLQALAIIDPNREEYYEVRK